MAENGRGRVLRDDRNAQGASLVTVTIEVDPLRIVVPDGHRRTISPVIFGFVPQGYDVVGKEALPRVCRDKWFNHAPTTLEELRGSGGPVLAFRNFDRDVDPGLARIRDLCRTNTPPRRAAGRIAIYNCICPRSSPHRPRTSFPGHLVSFLRRGSDSRVFSMRTRPWLPT